MKETEQIRTGRIAMSARLEAIVALAGRGDAVCDVGCDHAHVPIRLLQSGAYRRAIGMDVIAGPLGKAAGNLALYGMEEKIELRLSDGLDACRAGEAQTLVVTGMGGSLMEEILLREPEKTASFSALVLGPQSDPEKVRAALRRLGFSITGEQLIFEDGKYYPVIRAESNVKTQDCRNLRGSAEEPDRDSTSKTEPANLFDSGLFAEEIPADLCLEAEDKFGPILLKRRDPVLLEFLTRRTKVLEKILHSVRQAVQQTSGAGQPSEGAVRETSGARQPSAGAGQQTSGAAQPSGDSALRDRHLARQREIEHDLMVFRAALTVYGHSDCVDCGA